MSNSHEIEQVSLMNTGGFEVGDGAETKAELGTVLFAIGLVVLTIVATKFNT